MPSSRALLTLAVLIAFTMQCGLLPAGVRLAQPSGTEINQALASTFEALTVQAPTGPSASPPPQTATTAVITGSISGQLRYPADSLPAMYVTAYEVGSQNYRYVTTSPGQDTYEIDGLSPGNYHVIAYTVGGAGFPGGLAGGYTQAVPCGLGANCTDHSLISVQVEVGQAATGIIPADWYAPQGTFPPFPQQPVSPATATPSAASAAQGGIAGNLMYPASGIPALRIVAFQVESTSYFYVDTNVGQSTYELDHLPPGTYHVVAYPLAGGGFAGGPPGGYSQMVPCGLKASCTDHTLIEVAVTPGNVIGGVDPNDYYAPPGTFPPNPAP